MRSSERASSASIGADIVMRRRACCVHRSLSWFWQFRMQTTVLFVWEAPCGAVVIGDGTCTLVCRLLMQTCELFIVDDSIVA